MRRLDAVGSPNSNLAGGAIMSSKRSSKQGSSGESHSRGESHKGWKSKWVERDAPAADDPISEEEMQGHNLLGNVSLRGGALSGVSEPARDGHGAPGERPEDVKWDGPRLNPPELDAVPGEGGSEEIDDS
jgi:hypothetical protein